MTIKVKNIFGAIILTISVLLLSASAQLPSDLIVKQDAPTKLDLSNTAPSSAKAINDLNTKLVKQPRWKMADIGYATSEPISIVQTDSETATEVVRKFINSSDMLPANVGNATENITVINNTMVWF